MISVLYAIISLRFVVPQEDLFVARSREVTQENCLPFSNETHTWRTNGYVNIFHNPDGDTGWKKKSALKYYGGLKQEAFFEGKGGLLGISTIMQTVSNASIMCSKKPTAARLLVISPSPQQSTRTHTIDQ